MSTAAAAGAVESSATKKKESAPMPRKLREESPPAGEDFMAQLSARNNEEGNKLIGNEAKPAAESKDTSGQENKAPNMANNKPATAAGTSASKSTAAKMFDKAARAPENANLGKLITEESKERRPPATGRDSVASQDSQSATGGGRQGQRRVNKALTKMNAWKKKQADSVNSQQQDKSATSIQEQSPVKKTTAVNQATLAKTVVKKQQTDNKPSNGAQNGSPAKGLKPPATLRKSQTTAASVKPLANQIDLSLETENSVVTPRDIKILVLDNQKDGIQVKEESKEAQEAEEEGVDKTKKALLDLKDLFEKKIAFKWTGCRRQQYDNLQNWKSLTNLNRLVNTETVPASPEATAFKIVLSVPALFTFSFPEAEPENSSILNSKKGQTQVNLMVNATFFDQEKGKFLGRTCIPKGASMLPASRQTKSQFKLSADSKFEFYFFAAQKTANYAIVMDLYLERVSSHENYEHKIQKQVGWFFAPLYCLPVTRAKCSFEQISNNRFTLLKGSPRMLLDTSKAQFLPIQSGYVVTLESQLLPDNLQKQLNLLRELMPQDALVSDADSVPGIHCPLRDPSVNRRDLDSMVINVVKGQTSVVLHHKEQRKMNLVRLRAHYINCNEKTILKLVRERFEQRFTQDLIVATKVTQRRLDIKLHNSWQVVGPVRSVNLAAPVREPKSNRQVMEACANLTIEQVPMDPMVCILFEYVIEVRIETSEAIHKEFVTLAVIPYMPRITMSRLYPVELGDDYILESVQTQLARTTPACSHYQQVLPLQGAEVLLEGIVSSRDDIMKQVEIREQERQYQTQLDKMRRNRRRELERQGLKTDLDGVQEDEDVVKVKIEQHLLMVQLDENRKKQVRFLQECEMLKFQSEDSATGMNFFDSIKQVQRTGKIELNSLKKRYRQNLKTLKTLEKAGQAEEGTANYEDSDEEAHRLAREHKDQKVARFSPLIAFKQRALARQEASYLLSEVVTGAQSSTRGLGLDQSMLVEPKDPDSILLHNEAVDSSRINHLQFQVVRVKIDLPEEVSMSDLKSALQVEELNLGSSAETDQVFDLELTFGSFPPKTQPVTVLAQAAAEANERQAGLIQKPVGFTYNDIQCLLNRDLADYFKMFYSASSPSEGSSSTGGLKLTLSLPGGNGKTFASCHVDIKQSLRQRASVSLVAYEADLIETVTWNKIGSVTLFVKHSGQFVNPDILAQVNNQALKPSTVKKIRVRDPQWLKIKSSQDSDNEIAPDSDPSAKQQKTPLETDDERKLQRIAAFKARRNRHMAENTTMKVQPQKVCTHSRSRSGSRDSSPSSTMSRPMSASLVAAVRERCVMPQVVHMTEEKYIQQKKENFKPVMLSQSFAGERHIDLRVGEPSFFYIVLENTNERQPRTFTVTFSCQSEKVQSMIKLVSNLDELAYWQTYGRLERTVKHEDREVSFIDEQNLVKACILQNEIIVKGQEAVAVPFVMRSYKPLSFEHEKIQVKATYREAQVVRQNKGPAKDDDPSDIHNEFYRFTVTRRFQPSMPLRAFEPYICKEVNKRDVTVTLIPSFKRFVTNYLRPNYLGDVSVLVGRLFFKSNWGKISLENEGDSLEFDPVEVPETSTSIDLTVFVYSMVNMNQLTQSNPYDLTHVLSFKLRLITHEALTQLREADKPPTKTLEIDENLPDPDPEEEEVKKPSEEESKEHVKGDAEEKKDAAATPSKNQESKEEKKGDGEAPTEVVDPLLESADFDEKDVIKPVQRQRQQAIVKVASAANNKAAALRADEESKKSEAPPTKPVENQTEEEKKAKVESQEAKTTKDGPVESEKKPTPIVPKLALEKASNEASKGVSVPKEPTKKLTEEKPKTSQDAASKETESKQAQDKSVIEKPAQEKPAQEKPAQEKPVQEKPPQEKLSLEKPIQEKPAQDKPVVEKPVLGKATQDKPVMDKTAHEKPILEKQVTDKTAQGKPSLEKPSLEKPALQKPTIETPSTKTATEKVTSPEPPASKVEEEKKETTTVAPPTQAAPVPLKQPVSVPPKEEKKAEPAKPEETKTATTTEAVKPKISIGLNLQKKPEAVEEEKKGETVAPK